ncbi:MAG: hypothetical protein JNM25_14190 [Planctomycetes bacterium]|nr:hypothetical protein [Planctomycetota bacterium]
MSTIRLIGAFAALSLSTLCPAAGQAPQDPGDRPGWEAALARYKQTITRKPFSHHTEGRERIAQTRTPEALAILVSDYSKPQAFPEYTRYTIATLIGRHFDRLDDIAPLQALRRGFTKPIDTWMWVQALRIEIDRTDDQEALAIVRDGKNVHQRAAAIAAIGNSRVGNVKAAIVPVCLDFPKKESDRNLLIGAMTGALWENRKRVNDTEYREALEAYISLMAPEVDLGHTIKVQMARHLQAILDTPAMWVDAEPWLEILRRGEVKQRPDNGTSASPSFFGITTDGERFCYVIDMSDSMLKQIEPSAKPDLVPETGPRKKKKKRAVLDESDLPWHLIHTRWDLAREQLRISLSRLTPEKYFAIVWFGSDAGTLDACKGMIKATKANVDRVMKELDAVDPVMPDKVPAQERADFPDGKLRGDTNMHAGLRRAFALAGKGFVDEPAYVDPEALTEGCDTIFLVSDGRPSADDFRIVDKDYGEGNVVTNHESKAAAQRTPSLWYHGPYDQDEWLVEDVRRMNSFRRIRLYAIGIGEANMRLLERLAEIGNGEAFPFGKKQNGDGGDDKK